MCMFIDKYKDIKVTKFFIVLRYKYSFRNCPANYNFTLNNDI